MSAYTLEIRCSGSDGKPCRHDAIHTVESDKRITVITPEGWHQMHRRPRCPKCAIDHHKAMKSERTRKGPYWVCPECFRIGLTRKTSHRRNIRKKGWAHPTCVDLEGWTSDGGWPDGRGPDAFVGPFADSKDVEDALAAASAEYLWLRRQTRDAWPPLDKAEEKRAIEDIDKRRWAACTEALAQLKQAEEAKEASQ